MIGIPKTNSKQAWLLGFQLSPAQPDRLVLPKPQVADVVVVAVVVAVVVVGGVSIGVAVSLPDKGGC